MKFEVEIKNKTCGMQIITLRAKGHETSVSGWTESMCITFERAYRQFTSELLEKELSRD